MTELFKPNIPHIGKNSYSSPDVWIANPKETIIGAFTSIGNRVRIGHGTHPLNYLSSSPYLYLDRLEYKTGSTPSHNEWEVLEPVYIGNDVWIGDGVWIKNGISIGDGAIIGAKSVVTHDVEPYAIVCGNPAKVLRYRFSADIIKQLLDIKWWDLPNDVIKQIPYDDIHQAITFLADWRKENENS
jgi:acetyltransferase-like isoleucine patch superfamily enzyme